MAENVAAGAPARSKTLYCSFCLRSQHAVAKLVAGHGGIYICDSCVRAAEAYISDREPERSRAKSIEAQSTAALLALLGSIEETVQGKSNQLQAVVDTLRSRSVSWAQIGESLGISRQSAWQRFT